MERVRINLPSSQYHRREGICVRRFSDRARVILVKTVEEFRQEFKDGIVTYLSFEVKAYCLERV
jgi:hypothetical protein